MYKSGRFGPGRLSTARATTSAFSTAPGPPPAGVSSRKPRVSVEKARMSTVSKLHKPFSRQAVPISDTPSGPGKASGNMVRTVAIKGMAAALTHKVGKIRLQTSPSPLRGGWLSAAKLGGAARRMFSAIPSGISKCVPAGPSPPCRFATSLPGAGREKGVFTPSGPRRPPQSSRPPDPPVRPAAPNRSPARPHGSP